MRDGYTDCADLFEDTSCTPRSIGVSIPESNHDVALTTVCERLPACVKQALSTNNVHYVPLLSQAYFDVSRESY